MKCFAYFRHILDYHEHLPHTNNVSQHLSYIIIMLIITITLTMPLKLGSTVRLLRHKASAHHYQNHSGSLIQDHESEFEYEHDGEGGVRMTNPRTSLADQLSESVGQWELLNAALAGLLSTAAANTKKSSNAATDGNTNSAGDTDSVISAGNADKTDNTTKAMLPCGLCGKIGSANRCTRCKTVSYCGRQHQHQHWAHHKGQCLQMAKDRNVNSEKKDGGGFGAKKSICSNIDMQNREDVDASDPDNIILRGGYGIYENTETQTEEREDCVRAVKACVRAAVQAIHHHLPLLDTTTNRSDGGGTSTRSSASSGLNEKGSRRQALRCILLGAVSECLAVGALLLGPSFSSSGECTLLTVYPLVEMCACGVEVVARAAGTSLRRIAMYVAPNDAVQEAGLAGFLRANIDYIADAACRHLRDTGSASVLRDARGSGRSYADRVHMVVEYVFSVLGPADLTAHSGAGAVMR